MKKGDLRLGLVGAGRWGRNYIETIQSQANIELAWVADPDPAVHAEFSRICPVHRDWREAVGAGDIHGLIVATPPRFHAEVARAGIAVGLPILIEKPLTTSREEAYDLLALAQSQGATVWVNHIHLFSPGYRRLKELAEDLGPVRNIASCGGRWGPFREDTSVLWDWGPHDVALCLDSVGEKPERIEINRRELRETEEGMGEIHDIRLGFPNGTEAEIEIGNIFAEKRRRFTVEFSDATLVLDDRAEDRLVWHHRNDTGRPSREVISVFDERPLICTVQAFANAIANQSRDISHLELGVGVVDVLTACEKALLH